MSDLICITNRTLCGTNFLGQIRKIAEARPYAILLREKDLPEYEYRALAGQVLAVCRTYGVRCILHTFTETAMRLHADALHLPLHLLRDLNSTQKACFSRLGASCHSVSDAEEAEALGCTYITAGHIFATDCKKGAPPRGLSFLADICGAVHIPVYAIGGMTGENHSLALRAGAAGSCIMSGAMSCKDPAAYFKTFKKAGDFHETNDGTFIAIRRNRPGGRGTSTLSCPD